MSARPEEPAKSNTFGGPTDTSAGPPIKSPWGSVETIAGVVVAFIGVFAWLANAFRGYINSGAVALIILVGWLLFVGGARRRWSAQRQAMARRLGTLVLFVVLTASGPAVSAAFQRHEERRIFDELQEADIDLEHWLHDYGKLDKTFRREGYKDAWMQARIRQARAAGDDAELQAISAEIDRDTATDYPGARAALAKR